MIINDDHVDVIIIHTCRRMKYCEHVVYRRPSIEKKFYKLNTTYPKEKGKVTPRSSYAIRLSLVAGAVSRAATGLPALRGLFRAATGLPALRFLFRAEKYEIMPMNKFFSKYNILPK